MAFCAICNARVSSDYLSEIQIWIGLWTIRGLLCISVEMIWSVFGDFIDVGLWMYLDSQGFVLMAN
jgi:hypothetical protein